MPKSITKEDTMSLYEWLSVVLYVFTIVVAIIALILEEIRHRAKKTD